MTHMPESKRSGASSEQFKSSSAQRKAQAWQESAVTPLGVRMHMREADFQEQESDPRLQESYRKASELVMSLTMPERALQELRVSGELFTEKGMAAFEESIDSSLEEQTKKTIKDLRTEAALFGGREAPFHGELPPGALSETDSLAQEFYADAYDSEALASKQSLLLRSLGVLYGEETIFQAQQEMGLYLATVSSDQLLIDREEGFFSKSTGDHEVLPLETIRERGISTQSLAMGEKRYIDPEYPMLTEEEVKERIGLEESGALLAVVRAGNPKNGVTFGIFGRGDEDVYHLHYLVGTSDIESGRSDADKVRRSDQYRHLRNGGFLHDSAPLDRLGVAKIGSIDEEDSAVRGMLSNVHEALGNSSLLAGKESVAPRHVTVRRERGALVVRDVRRSSDIGATLVQSRSFGEYDNNPLRRGVRSRGMGAHAWNASFH